MDSLVETIIKNTYTTDDLKLRLALLREFLEEQFFAGGANQLQEFFAKRQVDPNHKKAMLSWNQEFYHAFNPENLYKLLGQLSEDINKLPKVILTTAINFADNRSAAARLARWFRQNLDPQTLIKLKTDPQIIGGVRIVYGDRYGDYSLKKRLEKNHDRLKKIFAQSSIGDQQYKRQAIA
jgi:F0F1-type ATP synthase delta subunit